MHSFTYYNGRKLSFTVDFPILLLDIVLVWLYYFHYLLIGWLVVCLLISVIIRIAFTNVMKKHGVLYSTGKYEVDNGILTVQTYSEHKIQLSQITKIYAQRQKKSGQQEYILKYLNGKRIIFQIVSESVVTGETFSDTTLYNLCMDSVNACNNVDFKNSNDKIYWWILDNNAK